MPSGRSGLGQRDSTESQAGDAMHEELGRASRHGSSALGPALEVPLELVRGMCEGPVIQERPAGAGSSMHQGHLRTGESKASVQSPIRADVRN